MFGLFRKKKTSTKEDETQEEAIIISQSTADLTLIVPVIKVLEAEAPQDKIIKLSESNGLICKPFVADLMIFYAFDLVDRFEYIAYRFLDENSLSIDELHFLAMQNLANRLPGIQMQGNLPYCMITAGGNFESTLLLADEIWDQISENLPGETLAAVPARDLLFVTGSEAEKGLEFINEMANKEMADSSYLLSRSVLVRRDGQWETYSRAS